MTKLTAEMRTELLVEMESQAKALGANAIVGISFETNTIFEGTLDVVTYGTAVRVTR